MMNPQFTFSSIAKSLTFCFVLLIGGIQAHAQTAYITNNADCDVLVNLAGATVPTACNICGDPNTYTVATGSINAAIPLVSPNSNCQIADAFKAVISPLGYNGTSGMVRTDQCSNCTGNAITNSTMTFNATTCYPVSTTVNLSITCSGTDIYVTIN